MPTYEYECEKCGLRFDRFQAITEKPISACPDCQGPVRRLISGGIGFLFKDSGQGRIRSRTDPCSLEQSGRTCCGRDERCGKPPCGDK